MKPHPLSLALALVLPGMLSAQQREPHGHADSHARQLDQLVVTASPLKTGAEDLVKPVEILAGSALDDRRAGTLGETVSSLTGVQSSFFGAGVGRPIIRGQEGARVQVLSEGIASLDASTTSVDHAVSIEPFLADQIEVLKGPATLLYGAGAIGGAVNVVDGRIPTVAAERALSGRAEVRGGSVADERTALLRLDGGRGRVAWHLDGFRRDLSDYEIPGFARIEEDHEHEDEDEHAHAHAHAHAHDEDEHGHEHEEENPFGLLPNSAVDTRGGAFGLSWIGERGFIGASISRYESLYGIPGGHAHAHEEEHEDDHEVDHAHEDEAEGEEDIRIDLAQTRYDLKAGLRSPFAGFDSLDLRLGVNNYRHIELEGEEIGTRFDNDAYEGRVELVHSPLGDWRGALGAQFSRRDFRAEGEEAFVPPSLTRDLGLFLIEELDREAWKLELGARADRVRVEAEGHQRRSFSSFSASIGALWRLNDLLHLSAGYDRAQRAPGAEELFSDGPHAATQSYEIGDDGLRRETANQLELAAHLHAGRVQAKLAAFHNRFDDYIFLAETDREEDGLPVRLWTQQDARFRGLEAEATIDLLDNASGAWALRLSADRVNARLDDGGRLPRLAPARFGTGIEWSREGWRAGVDARRYQRQDEVAAFEEETPGFTLLGAHLSYHWDVGATGWEVFLRGENLNDREARLHTSVLKNEAPLPGRNVQFGLRAMF